MRVQVTQEHIDKGLRTSASDCAIALAINARTGRACYVGAEYMAIGTATGEVVRVVSPRCRQFMTAFDKGRRVEPFEFDLPLPREERQSQ